MPGDDIPLRSTAVALLVAAVVGFVVLQVATSPEALAQMDQERAEARAYCAQVYDDTDVYSAAVHGNHAGLHCTANEHEPHLHAIPERYQEQAYRAQQNGTDLGWDASTAQEQAEYREAEAIRYARKSLPASAVVLTITFGIALVRSYRT